MAADASRGRRRAAIDNLIFGQITLVLVIGRGFVLPPLSLQHIDLRILGIWFVLSNIVSWLLLSEGGAWQLLRQQVAVEASRADGGDIADAIGSGAVLLFVLALFISAATLGVSLGIGRWFHLSAADAHMLSTAFIVNGLAFALGLVSAVPRAVLQGLQRPRGVNAALLVSEAASLAGSVIGLKQGWGVIALAAGALIREGLQLVIGAPLLIAALKRHHIVPRVSSERLRRTVGLFGWSFLSFASIGLRNQIDAFAVGVRLSPDLVPMSEYTKRFWDLCNVPFLKLIAALSPGLAHLHGEGDPLRVRAIQHRLLVLLAAGSILMLAGGWALNESFMHVWLRRGDLYAGNPFNWTLGVASLLAIFAVSMSEVLFATGAIRDSAALQLCITGLRIVLLFVLLPLIGIVALPASMTIAMLAGVMLTYWRAPADAGKALVSLRAFFGMMGRALIAAACVAALWSRFEAPARWPSLVAHAAALAVIAIVTALLMFPDLRTELAAGWNRLARSRLLRRR